MIEYINYKAPKPITLGKRKTFDNNIYVLDIESTSYLILNGRQLSSLEYSNLNEDEKNYCLKYSTMYMWQFSINDQVYYGRTWEQLKIFMKWLEDDIPEQKFLFVHNLSFEFQFLKNVFDFENVMARKAHKVMKCDIINMNYTLKCSCIMSNCSLERLADVYKLPVKKLKGQLDYNKIRHSLTKLTEDELKYGENDCLVVYHYILKELQVYGDVKNIPLTSTGHVRRELKEITNKNYHYKRKTSIAINVDPHVYNLLVEAFAGGYTHANWIYADEIIKNVDSYDITSSYPYVMLSELYPMTSFRKCNLTNLDEISKRFAYIIKLRMTNVRSKYFNNFISASKCVKIKGAKYDNGRIIEADELETTITDVDYHILKRAYNFDYEVIEIYYSVYQYLPIEFIKFILDKYVKKTQYKDDSEHELEYALEKGKFNALYGMSVTNTIRDNVLYDNETKMWSEEELTNEEIVEKLELEKKKSFLSFSWGVWVTAYARRNLINRIIDLDKYVLYCDTDSIKLRPGYDKNVFLNYNKDVESKIKKVCNDLNLDFNMYCPEDIHGKKHLLGVFECETKGNREYTYDEFITQGAKKYAVKIDGEIKITVAGVPKCGASQLKTLKDFKDNLVFNYEYTGKNLLFYSDDQVPFILTDYNGIKYEVTDKSGCCLVPNTYVLSKSEEYATLLSDNSSKRAKYKE